MAKIELLAVRPLDGKSTVKAFVDVRLGGVTLKGCKIVQQDNQRPWLAMPSVKTEHGWQQVAELSKPLRAAATEVVLEYWQGLTAAPEPTYSRTEAEPPRDPRQEHIDDLARRFDERGPDL